MFVGHAVRKPNSRWYANGTLAPSSRSTRSSAAIRRAQLESGPERLQAEMILLVDHDAQAVREIHSRAAPQRMLRDRAPPAPCSPGGARAATPGPPAPARRRARESSRAVAGSAATAPRAPAQHAQPLAIARATGERVALHVARQPDARGQHDVRVLARRVEPAHSAVGQEREIERHSSTLIWSRSSAATSNCSCSIARRSRSRSSPSTLRLLEHRRPSAARYWPPDVPRTRRARAQQIAQARLEGRVAVRAAHAARLAKSASSGRRTSTARVGARRQRSAAAPPGGNRRADASAWPPTSRCRAPPRTARTGAAGAPTLFSIVVRFTTASRSWQLSQSIRPRPPAARSASVDHPRAAARDPRARRASGCASRPPCAISRSRASSREQVVQPLAVRSDRGSPTARRRAAPRDPRERARHRRALLLAARELAGRTMHRAPRKPDALEQQSSPAAAPALSSIPRSAAASSRSRAP